MTRLFTLLTLLCAPLALAGKPTFQGVLSKFPPATLPFTLKEPAEQKKKKKLTVAEAGALGIYKDTSAPLADLRDSKVPPLPGDTKTLWPIARFERKGYQVLLLGYDHNDGMGGDQQTFLLTYDGSGALLGGVLFHKMSWGGDGGESNVSTLDQAGVVSRLITASYGIYGNGVPEQLVVLAEARAKLTSTGAVEVMPRAWKNRRGRYIDRKTHEELIVDNGVAYRADASKPMQQLEGDGNTVRFKGSPKPYLLTWNDRRSAISAQNPSGAVQVFTREW